MTAANDDKTTRITQFNGRQLDTATARAHELLRVALGTQGAPSLEETRAGIELCLESAAKFTDREHFHANGMVVYVNRTASPFPTFEVFVTATKALYLRSPEATL